MLGSYNCNLQTQAMRLQPGATTLPSQEVRKKIENYSFSLQDEIGRGFSSIVYKAVNDLNSQVVAIKVIDLRSLRDQAIRKMLDNELHIIKRIYHPNLLTHYNSYMTINNCYIVTEYCEGGDLGRLLRSKGRLPEAEVAALFYQIYSGYLSFHRAGYIHRDIKPGNIFLRKGRPKIADFGFAKKITANPRDGYSVGTPIYMAPECIMQNIYTEKSDIWALGVTLFELLVGETLFKAKADVLKATVHFKAVSLESELKDFIMCCLQKDPNVRIGLAEMQRHPWMRKVIFSQEQPTLTKHCLLEKNKEARPNHMQQEKRKHVEAVEKVKVVEKRKPAARSAPKIKNRDNKLNQTLVHIHFKQPELEQVNFAYNSLAIRKE